MALVGGVGALVMPVLALRAGNENTIGLFRVIGAIAIAAFFVQAGLPIVIAMMLVYYGVIDGTESIYISEIMSRLPPELRDVMAGLNALLWSLVAAVATLTSGWIQDQPWGGFGAAFAIGVAGYVVSAVWTLVAFPRIKAPPWVRSGRGRLRLTTATSAG
jgi:MFS family permease